MYGVESTPFLSVRQQVQRASRRRCIHPHPPLTLSLSFIPHLKGVLSATKLNDERIWRGWLVARRRRCNMHARTGCEVRKGHFIAHAPTTYPLLCLYCTESYKIIGLVLRTWRYQPLHQCAFYCRSNSLLVVSAVVVILTPVADTGKQQVCEERRRRSRYLCLAAAAVAVFPFNKINKFGGENFFWKGVRAA